MGCARVLRTGLMCQDVPAAPVAMLQAPVLPWPATYLPPSWTEPSETPPPPVLQSFCILILHLQPFWAENAMRSSCSGEESVAGVGGHSHHNSDHLLPD